MRQGGEILIKKCTKWPDWMEVLVDVGDVIGGWWQSGSRLGEMGNWLWILQASRLCNVMLPRAHPSTWAVWWEMSPLIEAQFVLMDHPCKWDPMVFCGWVFIASHENRNMKFYLPLPLLTEIATGSDGLGWFHREHMFGCEGETDKAS